MYYLKFLLLTPLILPKGETFGLHQKELQHLTPLLFPSLGGVRGGKGWGGHTRDK